MCQLRRYFLWYNSEYENTGAEELLKNLKSYAN